MTEKGSGSRGRGLLTSSIATSVAAILAVVSGLLLDITVAARFGAGATTDAFFVGARLPLGITLFALATATQALIPVISDWIAKQGISHAGALVSRLLWITLAGGAAVFLLAAAFAGPLVAVTAPGLEPRTAALAESMARLMFALVPLNVASEVLRAFLNAREAPVGGAAMHALLNVPAILVLVISNNPDPLLIPRAYLLGALTQFLFISLLAHRKGLRFGRSSVPKGELRKVAALSGRPLMSSGLQLGARLGEQFVLSFLPIGAISVVAYASRLIFALGGNVFFRSVVVVTLPRLTRAFSLGKKLAFQKTLRDGLKLMLATSVPLAVFVALFGRAAAQVLYQRKNFGSGDAALLGIILMAYAPSLVGAAVQRAYLISFLAKLDTRTQLRNTFYGSIVNVVFVWLLVSLPSENPDLAVLGVPAAYLIGQITNTAHAWYRLDPEDKAALSAMGPFVLRVVVSTAAAAAVIGPVQWLLQSTLPAPRYAALRFGLSAVAGVGTLMLAGFWLLRNDLQASRRALVTAE